MNTFRKSNLKPQAIPTVISAPNPPKRFMATRRVLQKQEVTVSCAADAQLDIPSNLEEPTSKEPSAELPVLDVVKQTIRKLRTQVCRLRKRQQKQVGPLSKKQVLSGLKRYLPQHSDLLNIKYNLVRRNTEAFDSLMTSSLLHYVQMKGTTKARASDKVRICVFTH